MRFKTIYVEITNYCNLNCSFCSIDKREKIEMTVLDFEKVINKIKNYTESVYLHIKGEPLLHSNLDEILTICDNSNIKVKITTNGTLLKRKKDILLKHKIKQINVSLHSENREKNYLMDVFDTCKELNNTTIIYRIWALSNLGFDEISTKIVDKIISYYHLSTDIVNKIYQDKNIKIKDNIYLDKDYEFDWPHIGNNNNTVGTCLGTKNHIGILSNGDIVPCCLDSEGIIKLGNIFDDTIDNILNSELFKKINNGFKKHIVVDRLCQNCTYRTRFKIKN